MVEKFLTLYLDPGEDFGWALANGTRLLAAGTEKMWDVADDIYAVLSNPSDPDVMFREKGRLRAGVKLKEVMLRVGRIVCEDWRLYPKKLKFLKWDMCRTARVIGAITWFCRHFAIEFVLQPASIKEAAQSAGAEEFYYHPLRPNRHQNDAIQHFVFFINTVLLSAMDIEERYATLGIPNQQQVGGDEK